MAVTDLTGASDLPWWATQGAGPTGTPSATPQGGGGAQSAPTGGPPAGVSQVDWLNYLQQMFGVSPQPATAMSQGNQADMPSVGASNMMASSPQPRPSVGGAAPPFVQPPPNPTAMPARPAGVSATGLPLSPGSLSPASLAAFSGRMPWRGPIAGDSPANAAAAGGANPSAPAANAQPVAAREPVAGPMATNSRFIGIDRPNAPAEGGPYGRSGLQGTALDLAGMFGGGGAPAAAPTAPAAVPGPLASSGGISMDDLYPAAAARRGMATNAPWNYGPLQKGNIWKSSGGPRPRPAS